jgi:hypothetical protein
MTPGRQMLEPSDDEPAAERLNGVRTRLERLLQTVVARFRFSLPGKDATEDWPDTSERPGSATLGLPQPAPAHWKQRIAHALRRRRP